MGNFDVCRPGLREEAHPLRSQLLPHLPARVAQVGPELRGGPGSPGVNVVRWSTSEHVIRSRDQARREGRTEQVNQ